MTQIDHVVRERSLDVPSINTASRDEAKVIDQRIDSSGFIVNSRRRRAGPPPPRPREGSAIRLFIRRLIDATTRGIDSIPRGGCARAAARHRDSGLPSGSRVSGTVRYAGGARRQDARGAGTGPASGRPSHGQGRPPQPCSRRAGTSGIDHRRALIFRPRPYRRY